VVRESTRDDHVSHDGSTPGGTYLGPSMPAADEGVQHRPARVAGDL
jgi:hypothetical protein